MERTDDVPGDDWVNALWRDEPGADDGSRKVFIRGGGTAYFRRWLADPDRAARVAEVHAEWAQMDHDQPPRD